MAYAVRSRECTLESRARACVDRIISHLSAWHGRRISYSLLMELFAAVTVARAGYVQLLST